VSGGLLLLIAALAIGLAVALVMLYRARSVPPEPPAGPTGTEPLSGNAPSATPPTGTEPLPADAPNASPPTAPEA
jgi:hypothetical protein